MLTSFHYGQCVHGDMWVTFLSPSVCNDYILEGRRCVSVCVAFSCLALVLHCAHNCKSVIKALQMDVKEDIEGGSE